MEDGTVGDGGQHGLVEDEGEEVVAHHVEGEGEDGEGLSEIRGLHSHWSGSLDQSEHSIWRDATNRR